MFCPKCARQIPDSSRFCEFCGTALTAPAQPASQPIPQPVPQPVPQTVQPVQPADAAAAGFQPAEPSAPDAAAAGLQPAEPSAPDAAAAGFQSAEPSAPETAASGTAAAPEAVPQGSCQPPVYQQPVYQQAAYQQMPNNVYYQAPAGQSGGIGLGIASMVCGILSLLCCCVPVLGPLLGLAAVVMGIIGLKAEVKGYAIAGLICGGIGLLVGAVFRIYAVSDGGLYDTLRDTWYEILQPFSY